MSEAQFPTLSDVAREAGVSLATVDRAINGRAGVSALTRARIDAAIERLGFQRNHSAAALAKGGNAALRLGVVLPRGENPFMRQLAAAAHKAAGQFRQRRVAVEVVEADVFSPRLLSESLLDLPGRFDGLAMVGFDHPLVREAVNTVSEAGLPVVTLVSDVPDSRRLRYVGIDNKAAGRVAGSLMARFIPPGHQSIAVLVGSLGLSDHLDRLTGFQQVLSERFPHVAIVSLVEGRDDVEATREVVAGLVSERNDIVGIYNAGAANTGVAAALGEGFRRPIVIGHELTDETRPLLLSGKLDALIAQSPGHEARSALRILVSALGTAPLFEDEEDIRIEILLADNLPRPPPPLAAQGDDEVRTS
ncbi:LacI family DNA-binding transcriptional regulator [Mangrovibrevibacter kandeliae]|uniref:LacI family DNA-binding transcriptional regulator n=1 Tax=Mangrovibrevibacter kandeliae TaxID=2968473 RepID=UPI0021189B61|nr:LacI family DNA-binding transcriptional regulator [Aurantimonas sp. CSK15Z-1]MCQ8781184.1 LacI family DNA-binding transcriptional regulator [Aurantimonas sp. CSK15Z-1]